MSICDIHCHILPGADDGVSSSKEALEVLQEAQRQDIRQIILTPHYYPGLYEVTSAQVKKGLGVLRKICDYQKINIKLYAGQECFYHTELTEKLNRGEVLTLAGSRYVLVEFDPESPYSFIISGLRQLQANGYIPVLAHFERYVCLRKKEVLLRLKDLGIQLQMNFDTLLEKDTFFHRNPWRALVKDGIVDYLGSDCHGMEFRPLQIDQAVQWLRTETDPDIQDQMLRINIEKILKTDDRG